MNAKIMEDLFKVRSDLEGVLESLEPILDINKSYLFNYKYGKVNCRIKTLMTGTNITLKHAVDKKEFLTKRYQDAQPDKSKIYEIVEMIPGDLKQVIVKNKYGLLKVSIQDLLKIPNHDISAAVDKTKYWLAYLRERNITDYDYSKVNYQAKKKKVEIICKNHGPFFQYPDSHEKGHGCVYCAKESKFVKVLDRLDQVKKLHKNKYIYNVDSSKHLSDHIEIVCPIHGEFQQKFTTHAEGAGCPACATIARRLGIFEESNREADFIDSYVYVLRFTGNGESFYKVGFSTNVEKRISTLKCKTYKAEILHTMEYNLNDAIILETRILRDMRMFKYKPKVKFAGYTECLTVNPLDVYNHSYEESYQEEIVELYK